MMAGTPIVLRVRSKKGMTKIQSLHAASSLHDLKNSIANVTGIDCASVKIMKGYPPSVLENSDENVTLASLGIKDGELFTVEEYADKGNLKMKSVNEKKSPLSVLAPINNKTPTSSVSPNSKANPQSSNKPSSNYKGTLLRRPVPANNSCLFTSVNFVMENGKLDLECQKPMRELIAKSVKNDPITFNEGILGRKNSDYCKWIQIDSNWGGSIEIMILSKYFKCEICVVDIRTARVDRFGEDCFYPFRVFIIYDGIHFDPLYLQPNALNDKIQTKFSTQDDLVMIQAVELANEAKNSKQFVDVNNFKLRCLVCQQPLAGQKAAQEHAEKTGHINFGEIN